jgi:hypothetical protein
MLHDWYDLRAKQIEQLTSLPENSLLLVQLGIERNVPCLTQLHSDLETFCTLVYECLPRSEEQIDISFDQFVLMTPSHVIDLMMIGVEKMDGKAFINCIRAFVIPYLKKIELLPSSSKPSSPIQGKAHQPLSIFLEQFLIKIAKTNLNLVKFVFEASVDQRDEQNTWSFHEVHLPEQEPIVQRVEDLLKLAINVIYANEEVGKYLDDAFEIVGFLPQRVAESTIEVDSLQDQIDVLEKHLAVCEACLKYHCPVSPKRLKQLQVEKEETAVTRFFNEVIRSGNKNGVSGRQDKIMTDIDFKNMLDDVLLIHEHLFQDIISSLEVKKIFIKCLLSFGREKFSLAVKFMKDLGVENCTQLILGSARDYVNSANSLTDKKSMTLAKTCLNLLSHEAMERHPEVREERDFIQALQIISDNFDLPLLPIQIRLMQQPRLEVIDKLLNSTNRGYKNIGQLLNVSELLRVCRDSDSETRETQVLMLIGGSALLENDFATCMTVCSKLMQMKKNKSGWRLCLKLGVNVLYEDSKAKHKLLSFALTNCDSEDQEQGKRLAFILNHIEKLEKDIAKQEERRRLQAEIPLKVIKGSADVIKGGAGVIKGSAEVISRESAQVISGSARVLTNELSKTAQDFTSWLLPTLKTIKKDLVDGKTFAHASESLVTTPLTPSEYDTPHGSVSSPSTPSVASDQTNPKIPEAVTLSPVEEAKQVSDMMLTTEEDDWDDWGSDEDVHQAEVTPGVSTNAATELRQDFKLVTSPVTPAEGDTLHDSVSSPLTPSVASDQRNPKIPETVTLSPVEESQQVSELMVKTEEDDWGFDEDVHQGEVTPGEVTGVSTNAATELRKDFKLVTNPVTPLSTPSVASDRTNPKIPEAVTLNPVEEPKQVSQVMVTTEEDDWDDWGSDEDVHQAEGTHHVGKNTATEPRQDFQKSHKSPEVKPKIKKPIIIEEDPAEGWEDW